VKLGAAWPRSQMKLRARGRETAAGDIPGDKSINLIPGLSQQRPGCWLGSVRLPVAGAGAAAEAAVEVAAADRRGEQFVRMADDRGEEQLVRGAVARVGLGVAVLGPVPVYLVGKGRHEHRLHAEVELAEDASVPGLDLAHLVRYQGPT
jgi:hypothetical protein